MRNYEVNMIIDPVLSQEDIKSIPNTYADLLKSAGCSIVNMEYVGLRPLAYAIKKRTTGVYHCIEFASETGAAIDNLELALRRDERIMRFLTVKLDKYGSKFNQDKRDGKIGKKARAQEEEAAEVEAEATAAKTPAEKPKKESDDTSTPAAEKAGE